MVKVLLEAGSRVDVCDSSGDSVVGMLRDSSIENGTIIALIREFAKL